MKIQVIRFNIYLLLVTLFLVGCASTSAEPQKAKADSKLKKEKEPAKRNPKKEFATIRFHLETNLDGTTKTKAVPIYRASPIRIGVEEMCFLDEGQVEQATLVDWAGNYAIQLKFSRSGSFYLDTITTANKGRRLAIYSDFGQSKEIAQSRWLAAPMIERGNATGVFTFTPDASREEAEKIVNGLNNIAKLMKKRGM
ncbi:MAG: hypothetical protein JWM68_4815 [Verrucomicrobiales bacterium]|nr:hypothetical protein [Verrucomicrobiales bacterium]